jgi:hypothetical protein
MLKVGKFMKRLLPSYPLFVKDPYFSIWYNTEDLTKQNAVFWHGEEKPIYGSVIADGVDYVFMGNKKNQENCLKQTGIRVNSFSTIFEFDCDKFKLELEFLSPLPLDDLELLSCPVCFLCYKISPKTTLSEVTVCLQVEERICYNTCFEPDRKADCRGGVLKLDGFEASYLGLRRQMPMSNSSDEFGADWGYYYLTGEFCDIETIEDRKYLVAKNTYKNINQGITDKFLIGFDDLCSIFYYGEWLKGYYFRDGKTIINALNESFHNFEKIHNHCSRFDALLQEKAKPFGEDYLLLLYASLRQSIAAHKLVADKKGRLLFLSKECNSDGCIATVDVSYPSMPLYLLYNPDLVKGMLYPILDFARMDVWEEDFAPHDAGIYPYCVGQLYAALNQENKYNNDIFIKDWKSQESLPMFYTFPKGSNLYSFEKQMPVEECGNVLIMAALIYRYTEDDASKVFISQNIDLFKKWVEYLIKYGLIPDNQLCTDDFAGHLNKNANLAVKAIMGIEAYSILLKAINDSDYEYYHNIAIDYSEKWRELYTQGDHTVLALDLENDSYSLKYNMAIDTLLGANLFTQDLKEGEVDYYLSKMNRYGIPLDSRKSYTKSDWQIWCTLLTEDLNKKKRIIKSVVNYLKESPNRVPFGDWYDTEKGNYIMFRNRTVQGASFILMLM